MPFIPSFPQVRQCESFNAQIWREFAKCYAARIDRARAEDRAVSAAEFADKMTAEFFDRFPATIGQPKPT